MKEAQRGFKLSIRSRICVLILVTLLPAAILQVLLHYGHFQEQRRTALQADLETARHVGASFSAVVNDISRRSFSIGLALTMPGVDAEEAQAILQKNFAEYPAMRGFSWLSPDGHVLASTMSQAVCADVRERDYFLEISSGKTFYMSDLRASKITGEPIMSFARGIRNDQGELLGVLHSSISPDKLNEILAFERSGTAQVIILDRKGKIALRQSQQEWTAQAEKALSENPAVREALLGNEQVTKIDFGGKKQAMVLSPIRSFGWVAVLARAEEEITGPLLRDLYRDAGILLIFAVAILAFAFGVSRTIAAPIRELQTRIASLAEGRKNQPLIVEGPPEIRDLTETFNRMAEEIHSREAERFEHLARMRLLLAVSVEILSETGLERLLQKIVDASRAVTGANLAVAGLKDGDLFSVDAVSSAGGAPPCPPGETVQVHKGGVYLEMIQTGLPIRYTDAEMRKHPLWKGPPELHRVLRGIMGGPFRDQEGKPSGMIMVSDRNEGDFTQEDEAILTQLAAIASLGIQHAQAHENAEKKAAEAEEGKRILQALMDNIPEGIIIATAPDANITMVSRYVCEIAGRPEEDLCGNVEAQVRKWKLLNADGMTLPVHEDLPLGRAMLRGETVIDFELIIETDAGEKIPILCNSGPIKDREGNILGGIVAFRDIRAIKAAREQLQEAHGDLERRVRERTAALADMNVQLIQEINERKKAEESARRSEERYRILAENVRQIIFTTGPTGEIDYCNQFWTEYTGLPLEAAQGFGWKQVLPPEDSEKALKLLAENSPDGTPFQYEVRIREGAADSFRWFLVRSVPLRHGDGRVLKWLGTAIDIDDRKNLEETLNKRRQEFQALAENAPDIVMRFDRNLRLSYANPALSRVLGAVSVGKNAAELGMGEKTSPAWEENLDRVFLSGEEVSFEFELSGEVGKNWFEARLAPEFSRAGAVESVLAVCRNINERILVEEERRLYTARLEQSNRDLEAFASIASHDLQEPMRKVQAFGDRLERRYRGKLDDEGLDYIRRMQGAAGRMQTMIRALLKFSRVSTTLQPMADTDLRKILKKIISDLEVRIEQKKAQVEIGNLPVIQADSEQMRHLFQNLIGNSLKFSGDKKPLIRISAREVPAPPEKDAGRSWYEIVVEDNGIGFEEEDIERIFGLFQRLHGRSAYEGSGIGLAICKKVVERHNGLITATSEPGKGSRFIITLPRRQPGIFEDRSAEPGPTS